MGEVPGLHEHTNNAIMKCDVDIRKDMYHNIVLAGGNMMFKGMADRMQKEVGILAGSSTEVKIIDNPNKWFNIWTGGSILASIHAFQQMIMGKEEYDNNGPALVHQ